MGAMGVGWEVEDTQKRAEEVRKTNTGAQNILAGNGVTRVCAACVKRRPTD